MKEVILESWEDFHNKLDSRVKEKRERKKDPEESWRFYSKTLFRGQSDSEYRLETTLDRFSKKAFSLKAYYRKIIAVSKVVETAIGKRSPFSKKESDGAEWSEEQEEFFAPKGYEYMTYLRHHGFPSPLLDWSRSPYIAVYFAFSSCKPQKDKYASIFTYQEYSGECKSGVLGAPTIVSCGPYIRTDKRHFFQQSQYTICKKKIENKYHYCSHEEVVNRNSERQDVLTKYLIPTCEKNKILKLLDRMNINAFSLMNSEDALMSVLAEREIPKE